MDLICFHNQQNQSLKKIRLCVKDFLLKWFFFGIIHKRPLLIFTILNYPLSSCLSPVGAQAPTRICLSSLGSSSDLVKVG